VQRTKLLLVLRKRPIAAPRPPPRLLDRSVHPDRGRVRAKRLAGSAGLDRPAAERDHGRHGRLEQGDRPLLLELAETRLALAREQLRDGPAVVGSNQLVDVDELPSDARRSLRTQRRLARAHEADERDLPI
jgi:hypothetical protein